MEKSATPSSGVGARAAILLVALGCCGAAFNLWLTHATRGGRNVDFDTFYAAGKLAGTGRLYDWDAIQRLELQHKSSNPLPFGRIPAVALALKPVSALPYEWAAALWLCAGLAALAGFVALWPLASRSRAFAVIGWSFPAAVGLAFGQDTALFLFFAALGLWLLRKGRPFPAGVVLSLCVVKPHLAVLLPVWLLAKGKWSAVWGGVAGGAVSVLVSFAVEGVEWPRRFLGASERLATAPDKMPNLRGLLSVIRAGAAAEAVVTVAIVAALWYISRRADLTSGAALALAGGLLVGRHAYVYDAVLLAPALLLAFEGDYRWWLRVWALLLFTPVAYLILPADSGWLAHVALSGYTLLLFATELYRVRQEQAGGIPEPASGGGRPAAIGSGKRAAGSPPPTGI